MVTLEMKKLRPRGIKLFKVTENWWSRAWSRIWVYNVAYPASLRTTADLTHINFSSHGKPLR